MLSISSEGVLSQPLKKEKSDVLQKSLCHLLKEFGIPENELDEPIVMYLASIICNINSNKCNNKGDINESSFDTRHVDTRHVDVDTRDMSSRSCHHQYNNSLSYDTLCNDSVCNFGTSSYKSPLSFYYDNDPIDDYSNIFCLISSFLPSFASKDLVAQQSLLLKLGLVIEGHRETLSEVHTETIPSQQTNTHTQLVPSICPSFSLSSPCRSVLHPTPKSSQELSLSPQGMPLSPPIEVILPQLLPPPYLHTTRDKDSKTVKPCQTLLTHTQSTHTPTHPTYSVHESNDIGCLHTRDKTHSSELQEYGLYTHTHTHMQHNLRDNTRSVVVHTHTHTHTQPLP
eukprot:GHVR01015046.1.p1 GENE.GHVR01015046.1~~GHVR01015046.1.p1  ORF type:complete len:341 (-),score=95.08 GHVR01015046.1:19-1041(-)